MLFLPIPSQFYSGIIDGGAGKHTHYVFSESLTGKAGDPVVAWFNGGPGCSSLEGAFEESGLYHVQQFTNPPKIALNPFSWNNVSHNLFLVRVMA